MSTVWEAIRGFGRFWYDFVVGDDWTIAAGVALALGLTYALARTAGIPAWWLLPLAATVVVAASVARASWRQSR